MCRALNQSNSAKYRHHLSPAYLLADSVIVGHYVGIGGLAAVGAAQPSFYLVNAVFLGLVSGFAIRFARMTGSGRAEQRQDAVIGLAAFTATPPCARSSAPTSS
ncbi:MATE family efflux transporter [Streptomyces sp. NPDC051576]|uniref:MATE family efflux transporter n=1 Tax=Streptomyces sp. NPDC051576 TaxID=3155803 RepID=UPI003434704A